MKQYGTIANKEDSLLPKSTGQAWLFLIFHLLLKIYSIRKPLHPYIQTSGFPLLRLLFAGAWHIFLNCTYFSLLVISCFSVYFARILWNMFTIFFHYFTKITFTMRCKYVKIQVENRDFSHDTLQIAKSDYDNYTIF